MVNKPKYLLFGGYDLDQSGPLLSGLFLWPEVFKRYGGGGDHYATLAKDHLEKYDVIGVNYTPGASSYVAAIRERLGDHSSTKIVMNVDFAIGMWNTIDPYNLRINAGMADALFHVEPMGAQRLSRFLGRPVTCMPHPVDIDGIKKLKVQELQTMAIGCQYHRYNNTWDPYFYATHGLRQEFPLMRTVLFGLITTEKSRTVPLNAMFDEVIERTTFSQYLKMLSTCYIAMDITPDFTFGRGVVEAAALGVPVIGSNTIEAARRCFPDLVVNWHDDEGMEKLARELLNDEGWLAEIGTRGMKEAEYYNMKNSYDRMLLALE